MVVFRPFRAVRPANQELAEKIGSLPYDVISSKEARELAKDNEHSFLHVIKPEIDLPDGTDTYADEVYTKALENFQKMRSQQWLIQEEEPSFYVYKQVMEGRSQFGIVGCVSGDDYWADKIKKHELTRKDKEADRIRHLETINGNAGPVFLFHQHSDALEGIVQETILQTPLFDVKATDTDPGVQHTIWQVAREHNTALVEGFAKLPHLYVADGHHRTASGAIVAKRRKEANKAAHTGEEEYNFFLAVSFPADELQILDYNRVVKDLNGLSVDEFLERLSEKFEIKKGHEERNATQKASFGMYLDNQWYLLIAKQDVYDPEHPIDSLDISIMSNNILAPILGITDLRTDKRIDFVGGIRGMDELQRRVNSGEMKVAFSVYPVSIEELMAVADSGMQMPPKGTWFEPKLRSGYLVHVYDD